MTQRAPRPARFLALASPIPDAPPVMTADAPVKSISYSPLFDLNFFLVLAEGYLL